MSDASYDSPTDRSDPSASRLRIVREGDHVTLTNPGRPIIGSVFIGLPLISWFAELHDQRQNGGLPGLDRPIGPVGDWFGFEPALLIGTVLGALFALVGLSLLVRSSVRLDLVGRQLRIFGTLSPVGRSYSSDEVRRIDWAMTESLSSDDRSARGGDRTQPVGQLFVEFEGDRRSVFSWDYEPGDRERIESVLAEVRQAWRLDDPTRRPVRSTVRQLTLYRDRGALSIGMAAGLTAASVLWASFSWPMVAVYFAKHFGWNGHLFEAVGGVMFLFGAALMLFFAVVLLFTAEVGSIVIDREKQTLSSRRSGLRVWQRETRNWDELEQVEVGYESVPHIRVVAAPGDAPPRTIVLTPTAGWRMPLAEAQRIGRRISEETGVAIKP